MTRTPRRRRWPALALAVASALAATALVACRSSGRPSEGAPRSDGAAVPDAVRLWRDGQRERAVSAYVEAVERARADRDLRLSSLTESAFAALPPAQQDEQLESWSETYRDLRSLSRAVLDEGLRLHAAGQPHEAERHFRAVERLGRAHADADLVLIWQHTGQTLVWGARAARQEARGARPGNVP